jgi:hypothetical protein
MFMAGCQQYATTMQRMDFSMMKYTAILMILCAVATCPAKVITVDDDGPADFAAIQQAINEALDGDVIVVKPGVYSQRLAFNGRRIIVRSEDPNDPAVVAATKIVTTSGANAVFEFGERATTVLEGFTISGGGISCSGASPTIAHNVIRDSKGAGITGSGGASPTIVGNTIISNAMEGVYACSGPITGNTISENLAGLAYCNGPIRDNVISYNGDAGGLYFCNDEISGNRIFGNVADGDGGGLYGCNGLIHHNLIAGNRATTDGGGLYYCLAKISSNTIVSNIAGNVGGGLSRCSDAIVTNNIIAYNEALAAGAINGVCRSTYNTFWTNYGGSFGSGAAAGTGDVVVNPLFAAEGHWNNQGTIDVTDDTWVDGDYHVQSQAGRWDPTAKRWVKDSQTSRCIDAGDPTTDWSAESWPDGQRINMGAYGGTPEASLSKSTAGHEADFNRDGRVGPADLAVLVEVWLAQDKPLAADLNRDGNIDFGDLAVLGQNWRYGPPAPKPPVPDPMTFATKPYATGPYSIAMVATQATSTDGTGVEYYFEDASEPQYNSGWLWFTIGQSPLWEDTGLSPNTTYTYRVKARNRGNLLETEWSQPAAATTQIEDFSPPSPNPMTWTTEPYRSASGTIRMVATTATDPSGVEYQFECTSHPAYSSSWQDSPIYEVTSLPHGTYSFRVRARDKSPNQYATAYSTIVTVDLTPPTPDPMTWAVEPKEVYGGGGVFDYHATMTATEAIDDSTGVQYYFECTTDSRFSSGWQTSRDYDVLLGRKGQGHRFRVKARDTSPSHNETGWSSEVMAK